MNFLKRAVALGAAVASVFLIAGCGKTKYSFYTNMPDGSYEILDDTYKLGESIDGFLPNAQAEPQEFDTTNFKSYRKMWFAMLTDAELVVSLNPDSEGEADKFNNFGTAVYNVLDGVDKAISSTVTGSDIYKFNSAAAGEKIEISQTAYEVLSIAEDMYTLTEGYYNPALYYNIQAYGFGGSNRPQTVDELPSDEVIDKYNALASHFGEIVLAEEEGKYFATKPDVEVEVDEKKITMSLDLGGIGKGYAVDLVDGLFDEYGYAFGSFNFGSSSILVKNNLQEGDFELHLINPRSLARDQFLSVKTRNEKISTSGDNEQFYMLDGTRYCHIIDPTTGKPVQTGIMSATVIGGSAAESDALTTAIMAMGKERATEFIKTKLTDRRVVFTFE